MSTRGNAGAPTLLADLEIPVVARALAHLGRVEPFDAADLVTGALDGALATAEVLVVRTVTAVDGPLLERAPRLRAVATASAGFDHIDQRALAHRGVRLVTAAGCNAAAVAEHVITWVAEQLSREPTLARRAVGVVGFGHTGRRVAARLAALGLETRVCDPPLEAARRRGPPPSVGDPRLDAWAAEVVLEPLDALIDRCGIVTLHVPRTVGGDHPTVGLIDAARLGRGSPPVWLNAARGGVLDDAALLGLDPAPRACLDVFDGEPRPHPALFEPRSPVARVSPHVAGYSLEAKLRASELVADGLAKVLGVEPSAERWRAADELEAAPAERAVNVDADETWAALSGVLFAVHDLAALDQRLRAAMLACASDPARATAFGAQRRGYPLRREFAAHRLRLETPRLDPAARLRLVGQLRALGLTVSDTR